MSGIKTWIEFNEALQRYRVVGQYSNGEIIYQTNLYNVIELHTTYENADTERERFEEKLKSEEEYDKWVETDKEMIKSNKKGDTNGK